MTTGRSTTKPLDQEILLPFDDQPGDRRSFLRAMGYGIAAGTLAGCSRAPKGEIVPWLAAEDGIVAGRPYRVATTCGACPAACGVLATCKDGRPVKLEGHPSHPFGKGALCAMGQASILELYDSHRVRSPLNGASARTWADADHAISAALEAARRSGGGVRLLTGTLHGPSTLATIETFRAGFANFRHLSYDPLSASAILDAHEATHGVRVLPRYHFEEARVIVAFDADFLGTWISPVEFAGAWAEGRRRAATPAEHPRHWHFEPRMTVTGGRADERRRLAPHEIGMAVDFLLAAVRGNAPTDAGMPQREALLEVALELRSNRGRALVVCGQNDLAVQARVNELNRALDAYGKTLDLGRPSMQRQGRDADLEALAAELDAGKVEVLVVQGTNPAYDHPELLGPVLGKAGVTVTIAMVQDETTALSTWVLPEPHFLERWDDAEPVRGLIGFSQPASPPLVDARTLRKNLAAWSGDARPDQEIIRSVLETKVFPRSPDGGSFRRWHRSALHDGFRHLGEAPPALPSPAAAKLAPLAAAAAPAAGEFALVLFPKIGVGDGRHAHNAWLQELADPVTRLAWEGEATLSPKAAAALGVVEGDVIRIESGTSGPAIEVPVHLLPGQHDAVVTLPTGYGRAGTERFTKIGPEWWEGRPTLANGERLGRSAQHLARFRSGTHRLDGATVTVRKTGRHVELATVQDHRSLEVPKHLAPPGGEVRDAVLGTTVARLAENPAAAIHRAHVPDQSLWPDDHATAGPSYGMVIDLASCTGCSACVIACQAENNVPVVGRDEVRRHREMAWIRIDRYEAGEGDRTMAVVQPMMCQHCGNAPCESVCPVLATVHSTDGLNQQVYNRCVGTRYCANTCPYKVRRFNWFDYPHEDELENHALNPDVTVRTRGVMEKCSLCVQRVQEARLEARRLGRPVADLEIQTACQQTCPTKAITFGDRNDPKSAVATKAADVRAYRVLEELKVEPAVHYLADVRHPTKRGS